MQIEIKLREIILSVCLIALMFLLGLYIESCIRENLLEKYQQYDSAVQIESEEMFRHNLDTNIGNAFAYGKLVALDPVTFEELGGQFSYIKKEEQEYTKHERPVTKTYTDSDGETHTETEMEEYWTWDTVRTTTLSSTKISFLNVTFDYGKIPFPSPVEIATKSTGYHKQNVYYGTGTYFDGTIYTSVRENTLNNTRFFEGKSIPETIEYLESGFEIVFFRIFWALLTIALVYGFCYLDNRWLD